MLSISHSLKISYLDGVRDELHKFASDLDSSSLNSPFHESGLFFYVEADNLSDCIKS